jgi:excisionase family DNA binding protein
MGAVLLSAYAYINVGMTPTAISRRDPGIRDTATELGLSVDTVRRYIATGRLSAYRIGPRLLRVRRESIDALLSGASS